MIKSALAIAVLASGAALAQSNCPEPPIWVGAGKTSEPPRPVKKSSPQFLPVHFEQKIEAELKMQGTVDIDGNIGDVVATSCKVWKRRKLPPEAEEAELCRQLMSIVEAAFLTWKFEPARKDGEKICTFYEMRVKLEPRR